jgi:hypothetical protein
MRYLLAFLLSPALALAGTLHAFGDSITVGYSATGMMGFAQQIANAKGWTLDNRAFNGTQVPDIAPQVYSVSPSSDSVSIYLAGFNDFRYWGADPSGKQTYRDGLLAMGAWLAIPESAKVRAQAAVASGSWQPTGVYGGALGRYSATKGDSLTFQTVAGSVVYVAGIAMQNPVGGIVGVTVDGIPSAVGHCFGSAPTNSQIGYSPFVLRIPGLRPVPHTVVVTVQSTGTSFVDWVGVNTPGPRLYLAGPLRMGQYATAQLQEFDHGTAVLSQAYEAITKGVADQLRNDGLDVTFVPVNESYAPTLGDNIPPDVHPNDNGHAHIARAFLDAMP